MTDNADTSKSPGKIRKSADELWLLLKSCLRRMKESKYKSIDACMALLAIFFFCFIVEKYQPLPFFISSAAYFSLALLIWLVFVREATREEEDSGEDKEDKENKLALTRLRNIWFWVFALGFFYTLLDQWIKFGKDAEKLTLAEYMKKFLTEGGLQNLVAIFFLTMLTDFILLVFLKLKDDRKKLLKVGKKLTGQTEKVESIQDDLKNILVGIERNTKDLKETQSALSIWIAHKDKEKDFRTNCNAHDIKQDIWECYQKCGVDLSTQIIDSLTPYVAQKSTGFIQRKLAIEFLNSYCQRPNKNTVNEVQANFGTMAAIVDQLYSLKNEFFENERDSRGGNTKFKIVYFTTLTMRLDKYLMPEELFGYMTSALNEWDKCRKKTRKVIYQLREDGKEDMGHMMSFAIDGGKKFLFRRCCIYLENKDAIGNANAGERSDGILTEEDWIAGTENEDVQGDLYEITPDHSVNELDHPKYAEKLSVDKSNRFPYPKCISKTPICAIDIFKTLYHPNISDYKEKCLKLDLINKFVADNKDELTNAFPEQDRMWHAMLTAVQKGHREIDIDKDKKKKWHEIFFNRHIPVDIFAIGVKKDDDPNIDWRGCLSGFVGGDFNRMDLGWHDTYVSSKPWQAIRAFIDFLYKDAQ